MTKTMGRNRWLAIGLAGLIVLAADGLRRRLFLFPMDGCKTHRFDPALWRDSVRALSPEGIRGCMVDHLLTRHNLRGRSRAEIVALLGEPTRTDYFKEFDLVYWLGPERGLMSIDSEWLVMKLDPSGRVGQAQVVTD